MGAIAAAFELKGSNVDKKAFRRIIVAGRPFGPDAEGEYIHGPVALGCCALWTVKESIGEVQPRSNSENTSWIVCDARIDNREELTAELDANRLTSRSATDAEFILASYDLWGTSCVSRLVGDFAFVIWDAKRKRLFCARDALGVRPMFYAFDGKHFVCASFIRQILQDDKVSNRLDERHIAEFLARADLPRESTPFDCVKRLPAGHSLLVTTEDISLAEYWDLDPDRQIRYASDVDYESQFLDLFRRSVLNRLRSNGPIISELSGGLDSSSIVCISQELLRTGSSVQMDFTVCCTVHDLATLSDEREWARSVIDKYDLAVEYTAGSENWLMKDQDETSPYWDEPCVQGLFLPELRVAGSCMRRRGASILLSGIGGDQVLMGGTVTPLHLADLFRSLRWRQLFGELSTWQRLLRMPMSRLFYHSCIWPLRFPNANSDPIAPSQGNPPWISEALCRKYDLVRQTPLYGFLPRRYASPAAQQQYLRIKQTCDAFVQGYLMKNEIEVRYPFMDRHLVEFLMAIPMDQKHRPKGGSKSLLRRAMSGILPLKISRRRGKTLHDHAVSIGIDKSWARIERLIESSRLVSLGYVNKEEFKRAAELARVGHLERSAQFLGGLAMELWLQAIEFGSRVKDNKEYRFTQCS